MRGSCFSQAALFFEYEEEQARRVQGVSCAGPLALGKEPSRVHPFPPGNSAPACQPHGRGDRPPESLHAQGTRFLSQSRLPNDTSRSGSYRRFFSFDRLTVEGDRFGSVPAPFG